MTKKRSNSTTEATASHLRKISLAAKPGALLGSEDDMVAALGGARATIRQAARLLEREGLLLVRRGINGGYFAARPHIGTVEAAASAYLGTLDLDGEKVMTVASALYVEMLRKAASLHTEAARAVAERMREQVLAVNPNASFHDLVELDQEHRTAIIKLIKGGYIELIFQVNIAFARRHFPSPSSADGTAAHREFVEAWCNAKLTEIDAIYDGNPELAMAAGRHSRNLWHRRVWRVNQ